MTDITEERAALSQAVNNRIALFECNINARDKMLAAKEKALLDALVDVEVSQRNLTNAKEQTAELSKSLAGASAQADLWKQRYDEKCLHLEAALWKIGELLGDTMDSDGVTALLQGYQSHLAAVRIANNKAQFDKSDTQEEDLTDAEDETVTSEPEPETQTSPKEEAPSTVATKSRQDDVVAPAEPVQEEITDKTDPVVSAVEEAKDEFPAMTVKSGKHRHQPARQRKAEQRANA